MIYLDWAATTLPDPDVIEVMADASKKFFGNPSSRHSMGTIAKSALEQARRQCAAVLSCQADQLTFSSGGSESNAIVLLSCLLAKEPGSIIYSALEHPSVIEPIRMLASQGWKTKEIRPNPDGCISPDKLAMALKKNPDTRLVAIMGVNNEIGAIQPIKSLTSTVRHAAQEKNRSIHFHADMVQALGKIPVNLEDLDIDSAAFSAHKIQGPRGIGLLYHRKTDFNVFLRGGGQESGIRPGTENVSAAMAMAKALDRYGKPSQMAKDNGTWLLESLAKIDSAKIIPEIRQSWANNNKPDIPPPYTPQIVAVAFPPLPGEVLARVLNKSGYAVSTGSACNSRKKEKHPGTMTALAIAPELSTGMIRISIGPATTRQNLEEFLKVLKEQLQGLLRINEKINNPHR